MEEDNVARAGVPQILVTEYEEDDISVAKEQHDEIAVAKEQHEVMVPSTQSFESHIPPAAVQHDLGREASTRKAKRHSLTPLSTPDNLAAESFDAPKLLGRSKSLGAPAPVHANTVKRNLTWNQQPDIDSANFSKDHCRLEVKCHIPYEPPESEKARTDLDLVIVYMFHEDKEDAHRSFFECPATSPNLRNVTLPTRPDRVANGGTKTPDNHIPLKLHGNSQSTAGELKEEVHPQVTNWLKHRHMLPKVLPFSRILCVGFRLRPTPKDKRIDFDKASKDLIQQLTRERASCCLRAAAVVGHGYGCRVVQRAIELIRNKQSHDPFLEYCTGTLFYNAPPDDGDPTMSELGLAPEKSKSEPIRMESFSIQKPDLKASTTSTCKLAKVMKESSISHHFHQHGSPGKDHFNAMRFSDPCDRTFQLICSKIVEWSETYHLLDAVRKADFSKLRHFIEIGININQRKSAMLETALHVACQTYDTRSHHVDLLIKNGYADVAFKDSFGKTPLHYAVARLHPDAEIVRLLLQSGAHPRVPDKSGSTPLSIAKSKKYENPKIWDLLRKPPLVEGPSATNVRGPVDAAQPHSPLAKQACAAFYMAATEMYFNRETLTEKHLPRHFSIQESIYSRTPLKKLLDGTRRSGIEEQLICRWYHLPANNMVWVEDLFRNRFKIHPTVWSEQIRNSEWPHGRCIIPHASQFTAWGGDEKEDVIAICMPYVSFEDNRRHVWVKDTLDTQTQPDVDGRVLPSNIYRLWKQERQRNARAYDFSPTLSPPRLYNHTTEASFGMERQHRNFLDSDKSRFNGQGSVHSSTWKSSPVDSGSDSDDDASDNDSVHTSRSRLSNEERLLVSAYLNHQPPLHARRTLDQYYYYMLQDTRERDADQVVTRWANKQLKKPHHNILMVDQLWLWVIKGKGNQPDRVVSCFPERKGVESGCLNDLQHNVLNWDTSNRRPIATAAALCSRIIATCSNVFSWSQEAELVRFLHFFEATVGRIGDDEINRLKEFRDWSDDLHQLNRRQSNYAKKRDYLLFKMLDIRPQIALLEEAKDIRDEINIILSVLGEQSRVLLTETAVAFFGSDKGSANNESGAQSDQPLKIIHKAIADFERMDKQTKEVQDGLNHLLDLQQKQASVWEARSAREGARATSKQSTVMVIFTMVTIIFLPLSFMASFFSLDIVEFPSDDKGQTNWPLHRVCTLLFGISFGVITPFIALAFATDCIIALYYQAKYGWLVPWTIAVLRWVEALGRGSHKGKSNTVIGRLERHRQQYHQGTVKRTKTARLEQDERSSSMHDAESSSHLDETDREEDSLFKTKERRSQTPFWRRLRQRRLAEEGV